MTHAALQDLVKKWREESKSLPLVSHTGATLDRCITELSTALSAMEGEAVAWMRDSGVPAGDEAWCITDRVKRLLLAATPKKVERYTIALYTAPPPQQAGKALLTNPHTGTPRDWRDVESDPEGKLIVKAGEPLLAYPSAKKQAGEWAEATRIACLDQVDEALREFANEQTGDNGTMLVREVMRALATHPTPSPGPQGGGTCETCGGHGEVGGWRHGEGWDSHPCPDCATPPQPEAQVSDAMVEAAWLAYERAAVADGFEGPTDSERRIAIPWMRAALTAALTTSGRDGDG